MQSLMLGADPDINPLTIQMLSLNFRPKHKNAKSFEKHLNPVMLVLFRQLSLSTLSVK